MKRLLTIFLLINISNLFSQTFDEPFSFYVFEMNEAGGLFQNTLPYMRAMENGEISDPDDLNVFLNAAYVRDIDVYEMTSLFLRAYFRETQNQKVRDVVSSHFHKMIGTEESTAISRLYSSEEQILGEDQTIQYFTDEGLFEEYIRYSQPIEIRSKDGHFTTYIPNAQWRNLGFSGSPDTIVLIGGGQTTSISVRMETESYSMLPAFPHDLENKSFFDLSDFGVLALNNADCTTLEILEDRDSLFIFSLKLYDEVEKKVYSIRYSYNISEKNINYPIFDLLKKHLLYYSFLSHLKS